MHFTLARTLGCTPVTVLHAAATPAETGCLKQPTRAWRSGEGVWEIMIKIAPACRFVGLGLCTGLAVAAPVRADDAGPAIIVTGQPLPPLRSDAVYGGQQVTADRLRSTASGRIEDALAQVAGFQQFRRSDSRSANPTAQGVTLRALGGNAASRSLVLLDGVPMIDPFFGHVPLSALAPERLSAVRVTRGGGAGAFGSGAVAGTIELASAGADQLGLVEGDALVDDRGESALSGTLAPRLGGGFAVLSGRWERGQGFWTTPESQRVTASARARYMTWSMALRGVAPLSDSVELQARGLLFGDQRTLRFTGADSTASGEDASLRLVGKGRWAFDLLGYVQARNFSNVVISSTSYRKTLDQRATPATGWGGKAELRPPVSGGHALRLGLDWRVASGTLYEDAYAAATGLVTARRTAGGRNADLGAYAEADLHLGALTLTGGARADRWTIAGGWFQEASAAGAITTDNRFADRSGWVGSLRGGGLVELARGLSLRASTYTGLRQPTLNELYRPFTIVSSSGLKTVIVTTTANAALVNERLSGFEGGLDFALGPGLRLSLTGFDNRIAQAVANVTTATTETSTTVRIARTRMNLDAIRARGIELAVAARWKTLQADGSLVWTRARVEASGAALALDGMRPAQTPMLAASATLAWQPRPRWRLAATVKHVGAQFEDDQQTDRLPAATTLDAFVQLPMTRTVQLVLRGENLFDAAVVTRNQAGSLDLGAPRTLWVGLRVMVGR